MKFYFWLEILLTILVLINGRQLEEDNLKSREQFEESARIWIECVIKWEWRWDECLPWYVTVPVGFSGEIPEDRETINTQFWFYTPERSNDPQYISNMNLNAWDVKKSGFNPKAKTKFITHGFQGGHAEWAQRMKDALLKKEKCNVFVVDWTDGAKNLIYEQAFANIRVVGSEIAFFIHYLANATGLKLKDVHLIGHSLGSHASGFAAKTIYASAKRKIARITGLDPAGPKFDDEAPQERLDSEDAEFVDVIHTNAGDNRFEGFGSHAPFGHFDFYPNGGEDQPGCRTTSEVTENLASKVWDAGKWALIPFGYIYVIYKAVQEDTPDEIADAAAEISCSHGKSYEYFITSINDQTCQFKALECSNWDDYISGKCGSCKDHQCVSMGYYADRYKDMAKNKSKVKFYLKTKKDPPYCMDEN